MDLSRSVAPDKIITTDEVLSEYLAFFAGARRSVRVQAGNNVADLINDPTVLVVPQSRESFRAGLERYRARPDKGYSLTDCISMQTMRREGLTEVLTNDRHCEQEGFRRCSGISDGAYMEHNWIHAPRNRGRRGAFCSRPQPQPISFGKCSSGAAVLGVVIWASGNFSTRRHRCEHAASAGETGHDRRTCHPI